MKEKPYQVVCYGEILWDVLPSGELPGGAPMNVAYHLNKLGLMSALITRIGKDERGEKLKALLNQHSISTSYVQEDEQQPTSIVQATIKENNEVVYDIVYPTAWDFIHWEERFSGLIAQAPFFVFGSLSARSEISRNTLFRLLEGANTKVLDINLRPPHYNPSTIEALFQQAAILKLNENELPLLASWYHGTGKEREQVQLLQNRFYIPVIIVTKGGAGALVNKEGNFYEHAGYKVKVADTVDSGDAFLAGFLAKTAAGATPDEALAFANAMGAFMATQKGACPQYDLSSVQALKSVSTV
ncbi:MAG: carbohydrate kinase [Flavisolibacter sp.]|nr:carbohydrate kinase [Flavisolibacter sp.]